MKAVTVTSNKKDELYQTTVILFNNIRQMCLANIGEWTLGEVYTSVTEQHFITEYTNGKMWIKAESIKGNHTYSYGEQ